MRSICCFGSSMGLLCRLWGDDFRRVLSLADLVDLTVVFGSGKG